MSIATTTTTELFSTGPADDDETEHTPVKLKIEGTKTLTFSFSRKGTEYAFNVPGALMLEHFGDNL